MSVEEEGRLEEERRLCYVGITRAEKQLVLSYAEQRRLYGNTLYGTPSRFLKEIPDQLIEEIRPKVSTWQSNYERETKPKPTIKTNETGMSIGQRVSHVKFGEGTIIEVEGAGGNARGQVNFDNEGMKWMILSFLQSI